MSCSRRQHIDSAGSESKTSNPSFSSLALYQLYIILRMCLLISSLPNKVLRELVELRGSAERFNMSSASLASL